MIRNEGEFPKEPSYKLVKIAPGKNAKYWDQCLTGGYICVGWDNVGDLQQYPSKEEFRAAFREKYGPSYNNLEAQVSKKANEVWTLMELQPGDRVVANQGMSVVLAVGEVVAPGYVWMPERSEFKHTVKVDWDTSFAKRIPKQSYWGTNTVNIIPPDLYRMILDKSSSEEQFLESLQAEFRTFRQDPFDQFWVKVRRMRAEQLRQMLSNPDEVDLDTFNREFWRLESKTLYKGEDITGVLFGAIPVSPERISKLDAALDAGELELHGNYVWRPGSSVYSPKQSQGITKEENLRQALRILNQTDLTPFEKAVEIGKIHSFGRNTATGAVMIYHPTELAIHNVESAAALKKLGYEAGKLEAFEHSAQSLKAMLGADDFLELDLFLYQINHGKYLTHLPPSPRTWLEAIKQVLREADKPLSTTEITDRALQRGVNTTGQTPERTVSYELTTHPEFFERIERGLYRLRPEQPPETSKNVWLFQGRPQYFDIREELVNSPEGETDSWTVTSYREQMKSGDVVIIWQAGDEAGIYALGELTGEPYQHTYEGESPAWLKDKDGKEQKTEYRVDFRYTKILAPPIPKSTLKAHHVLKDMLVLRRPAGTNFKITPEEWQELQALLEPGIPKSVDYSEPSFETIRSAIEGIGMSIDESTLRRYHLSLKTRRFVILSGLSGTGKTWLAEAYAQAVGAKHLIVPVAPNWTANEDLLGYLNPIDNQYHHTTFSHFLMECAGEYETATADGRNPRPYHLILDEMNLARVEQYFAKFLSAMEVRERYRQADIMLSGRESVSLTPNLYFIGTVNVDETTHGFAHKIYDRAQLIELQVSGDSLSAHLGSVPYQEELMKIWREVNLAAPFAFRVIDEIKAYIAEAEQIGVEWHVALDEQVLQKILPKCNGADLHVEKTLRFLSELAAEHYPLTSRKAKEMLNGYSQSGFASFF